MPKPVGGRFRNGPRARLLALAAAAAVGGPGCQSWKSFTERNNPAKFFTSAYDDPLAETKQAEAEEFFRQEKYDKARPLFTEVADNTANTAQLAERARFMQAECRRLSQQYPEAVDTYHKLLVDFPSGAYRQTACARIYEISEYWLEDFRAELDRRADEKGVLRKWPGMPNPFDKTRPSLDQEGRTLQALEYVHTHDITGPQADRALFWCGYVNYVRGNFQEADHFFSQLVEMHKDSPLKTQASLMAVQCKNNATGGAIYDGRRCAEALMLVHQMEATMPEARNDPATAEKLTKAKFAIRAQQAEKDFKRAEYYERTGHPAPAYFSYELVRRRYGGTKYSDLATERMTDIKAKMDQQKAGGQPDGPWEILQNQWGRLWGENPDPTKDEPIPDGPVKSGPPGAPPRQLPTGLTPGM
jgi:tetratricopeptide (TPR) repeat protein